MSGTVRDTGAMIAGMDPAPTPGAWVFATDPPAAAMDHALATIREDEGLSVVLPEDVALAHGLDAAQPMRRIVLRVHSDLEGVGLTAAVAGALAAEGIACNMIAGRHHDHAFVPARDADRALAVLRARAAAG